MNTRNIKIVVSVLEIMAIVGAAIVFMIIGSHILPDYQQEGTALIAVFSSEGMYYSSGQTPWDGYYDGDTLLVVDRVEGEVKVCLGNFYEVISETKEYEIDEPTEVSVIPAYLDCNPK